MTKLRARELRKAEPTPDQVSNIKRNPIYLVLDEVMDTYNIGSIFRLADAIGAEKVFLCGNMEYPPSSRIHKSAVGTESWVPWEKTDSTLQVVKKLKKTGVYIVAVEQDKNAISYKDLKPTLPIAIIVGHETSGIKKEVLEMSDVIVELPMLGINNSFNVWGSAAVIAYKVLEEII